LRETLSESISCIWWSLWSSEIWTTDWQWCQCRVGAVQDRDSL